MKKVLLVAAGLMLSAQVMAAQYQVTYGWTDTTVYLPAETKGYEAKWRVAGGAETPITGLTVPAARWRSRQILDRRLKCRFAVVA